MLDFLGTQNAVKMVELFCKNPDREFHSKGVQEEVGLSKATTIKWLKRLVEEDLLYERSSGRKKLYRLRLGDPVARQLRVLITVSELASSLEGLEELRGAYLIGDSARGTGAPDSPVELLILHRGDSRRVESVLEDVSSEIGREIEPEIMTPLEYAELSSADPNRHERLEREKIRLTF